jgi:ABC-type proline/glycine betaine transport system permease subunit
MLLGALPIVALALLADGMARVAERRAARAA